MSNVCYYLPKSQRHLGKELTVYFSSEGNGREFDKKYMYDLKDGDIPGV